MIHGRDDPEGATGSGYGGGDRAVSSTIGVVLVFGLVLASAVIIVTLGAAAIDQSEGTLSDDRAAKAMTQLDSKASLVALQNANVHQVEFPTVSGAGLKVNDDAGHINITKTNLSTTNTSIVYEADLGSLVYEGHGSDIAYQGGGVWRNSTGGTNESLMVSPPEFHFRNGTLTVPVIRVSGQSEQSDRVTLVEDGSSTVYPDPPSKQNPLDLHKVNVTVQSDYYKGWGRYFEERTDGDVHYDHAAREVTLQLKVPAYYPPVRAGLISGTGGTLDINNQRDLDSYNSSLGPYPGSHTTGVNSNSRIISRGDLTISNKARVWGDVEVEGEVFIANNAELHEGNISHDDPDGIEVNGLWTGDWERRDANVKLPDPMTAIVDERTKTLADPDNDNDIENDIDHSTDSLSCSTTPCDISAGNYHLSSFNTGGQDWELDTSAGNIELVVDGDMIVDKDKLTVTGPGRVNVYVQGTVDFREKSKIGNLTHENSTKLWVYPKPTATVNIENNVKYVGVVFGPGRLNPGADISVVNGAHIYGGVVGDIDFVRNGGWIHYDEALANTETVVHEIDIVKIFYLHVSENRIEVTN